MQHSPQPPSVWRLLSASWRTPIFSALLLPVVCLALATDGVQAQRTRTQAIALFDSQIGLDPFDVVMAPSTAVTPSSDVRFVMSGTPVSIPTASWLIYVDYEPSADFGHPTEVFLVPVDLTQTTILRARGQSWLSIDGTEQFNDVQTNFVSPDYIRGDVPTPVPTPPINPPAPNPNPQTWGLLVSGSKDPRHQMRNPDDLKCALSDVPNGNWTELGLGANPIPTKQQICDALEGIGNGPVCDKFYFVFTGHGGWNRGMYLHNAAHEYLDGYELACKILDEIPAQTEICLVINCCYSEHVLDEACRKFLVSNRTSSGIAATCADLTGTASVFRGRPDLDHSHFSRTLKICKSMVPPPADLKACVDRELARKQPNQDWYPTRCPDDAATNTPQKMKEQDWTCPNPFIIVDQDIAVSTTWTANRTYCLSGQIYVVPGATLTIEPGTVIANATNTGGSLAVAKGAQIFAKGTKERPIIFTSTADLSTWINWDPHFGTWRESTNEWGSLTLLGCAYVSANEPGNTPSPNAGNTAPMPGLQPRFPGDTIVRYGGGDDQDSSGCLNYVSLRYGGQVLGLNNELAGLSLGGVGRGTDIHHIEVINSVDDGVAIRGGAVDMRYVSVWNAGDDSVDIDQGWRGRMQFGLLVQGYCRDASQGSGVGDNCFEVDGAEQSDYQPVTTAAISNFTVIGQPFGGDAATAWRDNARVQYRNCTFMDIGGRLVRFDNDDGDGNLGYGHNGTLSWPQTWQTPVGGVPPHPNDPILPLGLYQAQTSGRLAEITDCVTFQVNDYSEAFARGVNDPTNNNVVEPLDPPVQALTRGPVVVRGGEPMAQVLFVDPRPNGEARQSQAFNVEDPFFRQARYRGGFAPGNNWLAGWTASEAYGFTPHEPWCDLGLGLGGQLGEPVLAGTGSLIPATPAGIELVNTVPFSPGLLLLATDRLDLPLFGGTIVPNPLTALSVGIVTDPLGELAIPFLAPDLPGLTLHFQAFLIDPGAPEGLAFSNAIAGR